MQSILKWLCTSKAHDANVDHHYASRVLFQVLSHSGKSRVKLPNIPVVYDRSTHRNYDFDTVWPGEIMRIHGIHDFTQSKYTLLYSDINFRLDNQDNEVGSSLQCGSHW